MAKNPTYWQTDPVGQGKGNQLPYIDGYNLLIIPDASTRQAALRAGKVDQLNAFSFEDAELMRKTNPELLEFETAALGSMSTIYWRTDVPPFDDIRVRQAAMMATDFEGIRKNVNHGLGQYHTYPFEYSKPYAGLYLSLGDPEMPESVKELFSYNPEKAKQLMIEAGYPDGFKTEALVTQPEVDYFSILKDMWSKIGIDMTLDVRESGTKSSITRKFGHKAVTTGGRGPTSIFYTSPTLVPGSRVNLSIVDDPIFNETMPKIRLAAVTEGQDEAMRLMKEIQPHLLSQAYAMPVPYIPRYTFAWPWVKNYSGELTLGYFVGDFWATYIWLDQDLKKEMGY